MGEHVSTLVAQAEGGGGLLQMLAVFGAMIAMMYFLMIRPERKKANELQTFMSSLKRGDEVVLTSGIIGKIVALDERTVTLEIADKVKIRVLKVAVTGPAARFLTAGADGEKVPAKKEEEPAEKKA